MINKIGFHEGVDIYVTSTGYFYCDVIHNSSDMKNATFKSDKLTSLYKAINTYTQSVEECEELYRLQYSFPLIQKVKSLGKVGAKILFEDGSSLDWKYRNKVYSKEVEPTEEFKKLTSLETQIEDLISEIKLLSSKKERLTHSARTLIGKLNKYKV